MKKLFYILILISLLNNSYGQFYDLIVTTESDSIACRIDSITNTHIYFEMKNQGRWIHTLSDKTNLVEYKLNTIDKRLYVFKEGTSYIKTNKLQVSTENKPGISAFIELGGKGYYSANIDFRIKNNHRLSIGLTELDYDYYDESKGHGTETSHLSPGIMYYYLMGKGPSYFELGTGISTSPRLNVNYKYTEPFEGGEYTDHPLSLHGSLVYRYQKQNGLLFRFGFTPFYRPRVWFLPLLGISLGYSW
jgi:hypothetical protein